MVRGKQFGNGLQKGPPTDGSDTFRLEPSSGVVNRDRPASRHGQEARQQVENKTSAEQNADQDDTFHGESFSMFWAIAKSPSRRHLKDGNPAEMTRRKPTILHRTAEPAVGHDLAIAAFLAHRARAE
jgi:hypothetical protein